MKFQNLDKLRGFAALSVLVYHVIEHTNWTSFPSEGFNLWWRIGWMGVDLFFVISGFVIFFSARNLNNTYGSLEWGKIYAIHRIARIAPLYFLTLFVFILFVTPGLLFIPFENLLFQISTHFLFIHNWFQSTQGSINGVNWSIGVEIQFYVFVFLTFNWLNRSSPIRILLTLCSVASLWKAGCYFLFPDATTQERWFMTTQLPGTLDEFAFGIVTCKIVVSQNFNSKSLFNNTWLRILTAFGIIWSMFFLFWNTGNYWDLSWAVIFFRIVIGLSGAILIFAAISLPENWPIGVSKPLDYLGEISYGIYLWHLPIILSLNRLEVPSGMPFLLTAIVTTLLMASFSYHILERPWIKKARSVG